MATTSFAYEALDPAGKVVTGTMDSESADHVAQALSVQQLIPTSIAESGRGLQRDIHFPGLKQRTKPKELAAMTRQFASMTSAGLSILRTLTILAGQADKAPMKSALEAVRADVRQGTMLSEAMRRHPDQFPTLMVNMIQAGELGGFLDNALDRIATMYESDAELRAKIKGAMTYPVIVLAFSLVLGIGVIAFIVPVFENMFAQFGGELPLPTRVLITLSHTAYWWVPVLAIVLVGGVIGFRRGYNGSDSFRLRIDSLRLRVPVFGPLLTKVALARWARNLGTLLHVGVPALRALEVVGGTTGNLVVSRAMDDVRAAVRAGTPMSRPISEHDLFPPMVSNMVEVGEETGELTEMLDKAADYYDREVKSATESLTSAMEPVMVIILGVVIGSMVISLYLPMFSIYGSIG